MVENVGVLIPVSSIPNRHGIGDFGENAYRMIDMLHKHQIDVWQILPLYPTIQANSPYRSLSMYAGDEIYISIDLLKKEGLIEEEIPDFNERKFFVRYDDTRAFKAKYLKLAFQAFTPDKSYETFLKENDWVENYAIYRTFMEINETSDWTTWDDQYKNYPETRTFDFTPYQDIVNYHKFIQFIFFQQWQRLKEYANKLGVLIFGDMPFYVDGDSVEVWFEQESFLLDQEGKPTVVAGVPPDYFSATGQLWGNPIYNWEYLKKHNFKFWIDRLTHANKLYNITRIDHFRAFDTYWSVDADQENAIYGKWNEAPGYELFDEIYKQMPNIKIVAEDLGDLRPEVIELKNHYHLKGMKVFQFQMHDGFDQLENTILYSGTHDNETIAGWFKRQEKWQQNQVIDYVKPKDVNQIHLDIIRFCLASKASDSIIPFWDLLGYSNKGRFNVPGTVYSTNWCPRIRLMEDLDFAIEILGTIKKEVKANK